MTLSVLLEQYPEMGNISLKLCPLAHQAILRMGNVK
jgi:hypothetical protein